MSGYAQPSQGDKLDLKNHGQEYLGKLFLIFPTDVMHDVETSQGTSDRVVVADVHIIDLIDPQTGQPAVFRGAWLFGKMLVTQTAPEAPNGKVLGRLAQGVNTKGNPPWMLTQYQNEQDPAWLRDVQIAEQYEATHPRNAPAQPAGNNGQWQGTAQQPQQQGQWQQDAWGGMATQAHPPPVAGGWQAPASQGNGAAPSTGQWQPGPAQGATPPSAPAPAPALDPNLKAFLEARGVDVSKIPDEATARQVAASFPS